MTQGQKTAWGWTLGILLVLWGLAAPPYAYWRGRVDGFKQGTWYSAQQVKETARETAVGLKRATVGTAAAVVDGVSSAGVTVATGATALATGLTSRTAQLISGFRPGLTSATATAGEYAEEYKDAVTSYTAELGGDMKQGAAKAEARLKEEARRAKLTAERQSTRVVSGVKRRLARWTSDDVATTGTETGAAAEPEVDPAAE